MLRRLLLGAAVFLALAGVLVALDTDITSTTAPPTTVTTVAPTTTGEPPTTEPATTTTEPAPVTTAPRATTTTRSTTAAPTTTVAEPELCPGLPHPAHHQPCPTARVPSVTSAAPPAGEPCGRALVGVRAVGLPAGWTFHCGTAVMVRQQGFASAGLAGWNTSDGNFIAINPVTGNHAGVGAHEACHAVDFVTRGATSEASADACAAAHGHPNPFAGVDDVVVGDGRQEQVEEWLVLAVLVGGLVLIVALLTLLPAVRRRLRNNRKDQP